MAEGAVLFAFHEACEASGNFQLAVSMFTNRLWIDDFWPLQVENVLFTLAKKGHLNHIQSIWAKMVESGVKPNPTCYTAAIQCAGYLSSTKEDKSFLKDLVSKLVETMDTSTDEVLRISKNHPDVIKGLSLVSPHIKPIELLNSTDSPLSSEYETNELLKELKDKNVENLTSPLNMEMDFEQLLKEQLAMEQSGYVHVPSIVCANNDQGAKDTVATLCSKWTDRLTTAVEERIMSLQRKSKHVGRVKRNANAIPSVPVFPFLQLMPARTYAELMVDEIANLLSLSETYSSSVTVLQKGLGWRVERLFRLSKLSDDKDAMATLTCVLQDYISWFKNPSESDIWSAREAILSSEARYGNEIFFNEAQKSWPFSVHLAIGRELLHIIMNELQVTITADGGGIVLNSNECFHLNNNVLKKHSNNATCPVLYKVYRTRKDNKEVEEIKPHPTMAKLFAMQKFSAIRFSVREVPMVFPPLPWTSADRGGYLLHPTNLIRVPDDLDQKEMEAKAKDVLPVFDCLNQLGSTPWKVNQPLLDLAIELFANQEDHKDLLDSAAIPRHPDQLSVPLLNENIKQKLRTDVSNVSKADLIEYRKFLAHKQAHHQMKAECYSLWCDTLYRLSIAHKFRSQVLYFPHNVDFRGRVYPVPPYLNHMGGDLARSLLIFAKGKPLGPKGLDWLKIHVVNMTGLKKKCSTEQRLEYANEILHLILDSADQPLKGKRWWLESEEPWQTLGVCMEIRNALNHPDGGPENYVSHLPVHQDGSCNGLQHYAALGRDLLGATYVNVVPSDTPQDVYSEIAAIVERKRQEDEYAGLALAKQLQGFVRRKVIKQTVMTTVYGVTRYGARLQIAKQLKNINDFPFDMVSSASSYLADKTFESLNEMFTSSQAIQSWFTECANVISGDMKRNVEWKTPLGLFVMQPYKKWLGGHFRNNTDRINIEVSMIPLANANFGSKSGSRIVPNVMKQRNGFPPNFVHSLDSTHMMLTSLYLWNSGITFAAVHDCYWTHAADVADMNVVCRRQFANLHSQPILHQLSGSFSNNYLAGGNNSNDLEEAKARILFGAIPARGNLDLSVVMDSVYFFS